MEKKTFSIALLILMLAIGIALTGSPAGGKEERLKLDMLGGNVGSATHSTVTTWASLINKHAGDKLIATVSTTGGSVERTQLLARNVGDIGMAASAVLADAKTGKSFKYITKEEYENVRQLFTYFYGALYAVTLEKSGIRRIKDLKGKIVSLGGAGSSAAMVSTKVLELHGITTKDLKPRYLQIPVGISELKDGTIDAMLLLTSHPSAQVMSLGAVRKFRVIPLEDDLKEEIMQEFPQYAWGKLKVEQLRETYKNVTNEEDVTALMIYAGFFSRRGVEEQKTYTAVKVLFENLEEFCMGYPPGKTIRLDSVFVKEYAPLHLGAIRYYREKGLKIPADLIPPEAK
jgi:hypothetical protein